MKNKQFIILAVVCVVTLLPFMGLTDFHTKGEPREAIVAYSMIETGNWTLPVNNGGDIAYKPPLFHWCIAALSSIAGKVTEYTSRMPSALALIAMVLGGFLFYAKRRGASVALLMGLITLSNFEVHRAGMNCRVDMMLTAFIVLALYQLYRWCEKGQKGFPWIATLFMGCATLTKGPVGILLPCMVTGVFLLIRGTSFFKAFFSMALVAITSCILPALWYIAAYQQGGDNFISLVMEENFGRFMGKMSYESHENPAYYNIITVVSGYAPYTLLVLLSLFSLTYGKITGKPREWWQRFTTYIREMDSTRLFSLLSIVLIFVFYCIPKSKRSVYLLPIYPFIAYFLAEYIMYLVRKNSKAVKIYGRYSSPCHIYSRAVRISARQYFPRKTRRREYSLHERVGKYLTQRRPHHRHLPAINCSHLFLPDNQEKRIGNERSVCHSFRYILAFHVIGWCLPARHTEHQIGQRNGGRYPGNSFGQQDLFLCSCRYAPFLHGQFLSQRPDRIV